MFSLQLKALTFYVHTTAWNIELKILDLKPILLFMQKCDTPFTAIFQFPLLCAIRPEDVEKLSNDQSCKFE